MRKETWVIMSNKDIKERMDKMDGYVGNYSGKIGKLLDMYEELKSLSDEQGVSIGAVWNMAASISKSIPKRMQFLQYPVDEAVDSVSELPIRDFPSKDNQTEI